MPQTGGIDAAHLTNLIDASLGTAAFIPTVLPLWCRLMIINAASSTTHGTEYPPGGGYVTGGLPITFAGANYNTLVAGSGACGNNPITWPNMPASTVTGLETWVSSAPPKRKWWSALIVPVPVLAGDTFSFPASSVIPQIAA
jgi:hypothetical protein